MKKILLSFFFLASIFLLQTALAKDKDQDEFRSQFNLTFLIDTEVTTDSNKNINNTFTIKPSFNITKTERISLNVSAEKIYPENIKRNESEFYLTSPYLQYSKLDLYKESRFSWDVIFLRLIGPSPQIYDKTSQYAGLRPGTAYSIHIIKDLSFSHSLLLTKYFNKYSNGPTGSYSSWDVINSFTLQYDMTKQLKLVTSYTIINTISYSGTNKSFRATSLGFNLTLPEQFFTSISLKSSGENTKYHRNELQLYDRNRSSINLSLGKTF